MKKIIVLLLSILIFAGSVQLVLYKQPTPQNYVSLSQGIVSYNTYGSSGKTIIMIHGSPGSADEDFRLLGPAMADKYLVYAPDMYGFGKSNQYVENYGAAQSAETIKEFMDAKRIDKAIILGYSWGGQVAIKFASRFPERTEKLVLLDGAGIQEGEPTHSYFWERTRSIISYPFVVFYPGSFAGGIEWRNGFMRSYLDSDQRPIRTQLQNLRVPALLLHGDRDSVIEPWVAEEHASLIPNSRLIFFSGGHGTIFSNVSEISKILKENI